MPWHCILIFPIYKDFQGLRIFFDDPVLPDNGYDGRNWRDDFQLTLHKQDEVHVSCATGMKREKLWKNSSANELVAVCKRSLL